MGRMNSLKHYVFEFFRQLKGLWPSSFLKPGNSITFYVSFCQSRSSDILELNELYLTQIAFKDSKSLIKKVPKSLKSLDVRGHIRSLATSHACNCAQMLGNAVSRSNKHIIANKGVPRVPLEIPGGANVTLGETRGCRRFPLKRKKGFYCNQKRIAIYKIYKSSH